MTAQAVSPRLTPEAVALIKHFESLRLDAYSDPVGVPTIGYGHTRGVRLGTSIAPAQAEEFLRLDLNDAQADVMRNVKVPMNDNEYGALVSLVFNIGGSAFSRSRCLALLNRGDRSGAAEEFQRFVNGHIGGRKVTLRGLQTRRAAERELFCTIAQIPSESYAVPPGQQTISQPPAVAVARISTRELLPDAAIALPRAWMSLERWAAAAGMGAGLGAVPILETGPEQTASDQVGNLWQTASNVLSSIPGWLGAWIDKLSQQAQSESMRSLLSQTGAFLQSHTAVAIVLGVIMVFLTRRMLVRLLWLR